MKTTYSILYATLRPFIQEKLSLGLLMVSNGIVLFRYSDHKLGILKELLSSESYKLLHSVVSGLTTHSNDHHPLNHELSFSHSSIKNLDDRDLRYLAQYSHNIVTFSDPNTIDLAGDQELFDRLFDKYIGQYTSDHLPSNQKQGAQKSFKKIIEQQLYPKIKPYVNLDQQLTSDNLPTLILPIEVNFIGINGAPVAGKAIFFDKKTYHLNNDIGIFINLIRSFEAYKKYSNGKYFIIGDEPAKSNYQSHDIWNQIKQSDYISLVPSYELDQVCEYLENQHVVPFIQ